MHLTAVISNIGDGVARNFTVGWRMQGNAPYMRVAQGLTLNPGEDATVEWDHVFTNPGTEDSQVWADMDNRVRESNEDNNAMGLRFRKRSAEGPQPGSAPAEPQPVETLPAGPAPELDARLRLDRLRADDRKPAAGDEIAFTARVTNRESEEVSGFSVSFQPGPGEAWIPAANDLRLGPGERANITWNFAHLAPGTFRAAARIDGLIGNQSSDDVRVACGTLASRPRPTTRKT